MTFCGGYTNDQPHSTYFFHMVSKKSKHHLRRLLKALPPQNLKSAKIRHHPEWKIPPGDRVSI